MPERVHTRFEEDDEEFTPRASVTHAQPPENGQQSKKRKREQRTSTDERASATAIGTTLLKEKNDSVKADSLKDGTGLHEAAKELNSRSKQHVKAVETKPRPDRGALVTKAQALLQTRKALPIWTHQQEIRSALREHDVLVLSGETGSGKSTQIPQFLQSEQRYTGKIAVTQPRRVAAISLARRVAEEMGTPLGSASPASKVGYSVRFDNSVSPSTKIKFLTEGMLLQEMLRDASLLAYSVVIVDEVHERSVNVDLILGFLGTLVRKRSESGKPLKVVVMSATAEVDKIARFFDEGFDLPLPADRPAVDDSDVESDSSWSGISSSADAEEDERKAVTNGTLKAVSDKSKNGQRIAPLVNGGTKTSLNGDDHPTQLGDDLYEPRHVSIKAIKGRQFPVQISYLPEASNDFIDACVKAIFQIHTKEPLPGDILVFLPGQEAIESLERQINELSAVMDRELPRILTLPLFAALPQAAQQQIFHPAPARTRKIILSTNIAETSVTVPGIRHVIDCGKAKKKMYHSRIRIEALLPKPISRSEAIQRKGRAGREAPGKCYRLYTEDYYVALEENVVPEILRCDLSQAVLVMKARGVRDVLSFPLLDSPPLPAMTKALELLLQLGALDEDGSINEIGQKIAKLPLTPAHGRVIVEAADPERDCLSEIIDILACLSVENVFLNPATEEKREMADEARRGLFRREGDHMTLLSTVREYAAEQSDRKAWAEKRWVSHRAMQNVMNVRKQLYAQCKQLGLLPQSSQLMTDDFEPVTEAKAQVVVQCLLRGFLYNTATLMPDGSYKTIHGRHLVAIHPSSVLFGKKVEAIMFSEFLFTNKAYARGVSAVQIPWISELL